MNKEDPHKKDAPVIQTGATTTASTMEILPVSSPNIKPDWGNITVTLIPLVTATKSCRHVPLHNVVDVIKGDKLIAKTMEVRRVKAERAAGRATKDDCDKAKRKLPAALFSGKFSYADNDGLTKHSGLLMVDFDDLTEHNLDPEAWKARLASDPHTVLLFTSPSGNGLKWLVPVNATDETSHKACFEAMKSYVSQNYPELVKCECIDDSRSDLSGKCFLCRDPDAILRTPSQRFDPDQQHLPLTLTAGAQSRLAGTHVGGSLERHGGLGDWETERLGDCVTLDPQLLEAILLKAVPNHPNTNHNHLFLLAKGCLDIKESLGRALSLSEKQAVFGAWHSRVPPECLRMKRSEYWEEFLNALGTAKKPLLDSILNQAWHRSASGPNHPNTNGIENPDILRLARFVGALSDGGDGLLFFLSTRTAAELMGTTPVTISRWLRMLCQCGVISEVEKGRMATRKASTYGYNPIPQPSDKAA